MRLIAFCEAAGDFRLLSGLVDRVLRESAPGWVVDLLDSPEAVRTWEPDGLGRAYFDLHKLDQYEERLKVRVPHGHFDGRPGGAGALMARTVFWIVRALPKQDRDPIDGVVLVWDVDQQRDQRPEGVAAARDEARRWASFQIVCGFPDPEREAWVLAGFDPADEAERSILDELHQRLGFSPVLHAGRLRDKDEGALRNIKRVFREVTRHDSGREERCWTEPQLTTLRARGVETGLAAFLDEVESVLLPVVDPGAAKAPAP